MDALTLLGTNPTCTLSPEELSRRLAWIRSEILPQLRHEQRLATGIAWELEESPGLAEKLARWAALESRCCSDLVLEPAPCPRPGHLRLEIRRKAP